MGGGTWSQVRGDPRSQVQGGSQVSGLGGTQSKVWGYPVSGPGGYLVSGLGEYPSLRSRGGTWSQVHGGHTLGTPPVKEKIFDTRFGLIHVQTGKKNFAEGPPQ